MRLTGKCQLDSDGKFSRPEKFFHCFRRIFAEEYVRVASRENAVCLFHSEMGLFNVDCMVVFRGEDSDFNSGGDVERVNRTLLAGAEIGEGSDQLVRERKPVQPFQRKIRSAVGRGDHDNAAEPFRQFRHQIS